jgi:hypothetical protein
VAGDVDRKRHLHSYRYSVFADGAALRERITLCVAHDGR